MPGIYQEGHRREASSTPQDAELSSGSIPFKRVDPFSGMTFDEYLARSFTKRISIASTVYNQNIIQAREQCRRLQADWVLVLGLEIVSSGKWAAQLDEKDLEKLARDKNSVPFILGMPIHLKTSGS